MSDHENSSTEPISVPATEPMPVSVTFQLSHYLGYLVHQAGGSVTISTSEMKEALSGRTLRKYDNPDGTITIDFK